MPVSKRIACEQAGRPYWTSECGRAVVYVGDCREVMAQMEPEQFHAVVTDSPYELNFMGRGWDSTGVAYDVRTWDGVSHVAKPGAHLLSFGGTRMWHRMACAVEDAGWEIRDTIMWVYSQGMPKGQDISKAIDKQLGAIRQREPGGSATRAGDGSIIGLGHSGSLIDNEPITDAARQWSGWNTTLKPAYEPIILARKPMSGTVAQCVMDNGCGALNINGCRVGEELVISNQNTKSSGSGIYAFNREGASFQGGPDKVNIGRHPANLIHDGSDEVVDLLPDGAARYFYTAKAGGDRDRPHGKDATTIHPTCKPLDLMRYLVRLVCARGGTVLDPFTGSGSTGCAAVMEGMRFVGVEQSQEYADIAVGRLRLALQSAPDLEELRTHGSGKRRSEQDTPPPPKKLR